MPRHGVGPHNQVIKNKRGSNSVESVLRPQASGVKAEKRIMENLMLCSITVEHLCIRTSRWQTFGSKGLRTYYFRTS